MARYIGRHGTGRVAEDRRSISAVPPLMLKTAANPGGLPIDVFDGIRAGSVANRSQFYKDLASGPFFGFNRPGAKPSQGLIDSFWAQGMQAGHKATYDCIKAFSETDFTEDLKKFDVPTLIVHGDDDQIVPIDAAGKASAKLVPQATLKVYAGAPHGLTDTHKERSTPTCSPSRRPWAADVPRARARFRLRGGAVCTVGCPRKSRPSRSRPSRTSAINPGGSPGCMNAYPS